MTSFPIFRTGFRLRRFGATLLTAAGLALGCALPVQMTGAPVTAPAFADDQADEIKMGTEAESQLAKTTKFVTDADTVARVEAITKKLAAVANKEHVPAGFGNSALYTFNYRIKVIDKKDVNAFSLPGGPVYIYKGLLDNLKTDDEIAAVLAHEVAHASHHHVPQLIHEQNKMGTQMALGVLVALLAKVPADQLGNLAAGAQYAQMAILNNHYSEAAEQDADHTGMVYMVKAGYNPLGMLSLLQRLKDIEDRSPTIDLGFLQDHPLTDERLAAARKELAELGFKVDPALMWQVSGSMKTRVMDITSNNMPALRVSFGRRSVAVIAPAERTQGLAAAKALDNLLATNAQGYQVRAIDNVVYASGKPILTFTPADVALQIAPTTPKEMASVAASTIKDALWEVSVRGIQAQ
ncbi:MAG TPA: M48 family metalloprotease [Capsulimonadaceae bacterium]|jgi:predicted Zn-dependent protease